MSTATRTWLRALLAVAGGAELLMVAGAPPALAVVGVIGGLALVAAALGFRERQRVEAIGGCGGSSPLMMPSWSRLPLVVLLVVGVVPITVLAWTSLVPVLLLLAVVAIAAPLLRHPHAPTPRELRPT